MFFVELNTILDPYNMNFVLNAIVLIRHTFWCPVFTHTHTNTCCLFVHVHLCQLIASKSLRLCCVYVCVCVCVCVWSTNSCHQSMDIVHSNRQWRTITLGQRHFIINCIWLWWYYIAGLGCFFCHWLISQLFANIYTTMIFSCVHHDFSHWNELIEFDF